MKRWEAFEAIERLSFDLCLQLGGKYAHPDHLMAELTWCQILDWVRFVERHGPIGNSRRDFYTSFIAMHASGPHRTQVSTKDFPMPWEPKNQTAPILPGGFGDA